MFEAKVTMRVAEYCLILFSLFIHCHGLDCRSDGGPKEKELKKIYDMCVKQQKKSNTSDDLDQGLTETRTHNQWSQDLARHKGTANNGYGSEERNQGEGNRMDSRDRTERQHSEVSRQYGRNKSRDTRMQNRGRDEEDMYSRDGRGEKQNSNNGNKSQRNNGVSDRNEFFENEGFNAYNNNNQYSTQPTRRYKRERRVEENSGKRSQYNPNPQQISGHEEKHSGKGKNSTESNSTNEDNNACAVHCLLENLQMTDESGMPDRYLVTHVITKDVRDEDLKDFLQESIEECFQILSNENTVDKCKFSKDLLMCLSEKGRANCDDWKDDFQF